MQAKSVWKPERWWLEAPDVTPTLADDLRTGVPALPFTNDAGMTVTIVFERTGELREVRFAGMTAEAIRYVRIAELADQARRIISAWVVGYETSRPVGVRQQEVEARERLHTWGAKYPHLDMSQDEAISSGWALADMTEGFGPPARPGRAGRSDLELAAVAAVYVERCVNGGDKVGVVARSLGIEPTTFSTRLKAARSRGLLTGNPKRGDVTGALTPKAEAILAKATSQED